MTQTETPWQVRVGMDDVAEEGSHIELSADESARAAIAEMAGLSALPRLEAIFDVKRWGRGMRVVGEVRATVGQTCVITLEPLENEISEPVDLVFAPAPAGPEPNVEEDERTKEPPEPLVDGSVDLGALATEFLVLGIDRYPRKPGAVFGAASVGEDAAHPFAALGQLKQKPSPERG